MGLFADSNDVDLTEAFASLGSNFPSTPKAEVEAPKPDLKPSFRSSPSQRKAARPNKYAGACRNCGGWVEAEAGKLGPYVEGKWTIEHNGQCPLLDPDEAPAPRPAPKVQVPRKITEPLIDGKYTVVFEDGTYRTIEVRTQSEADEFKPGCQILGFLSGRDNDLDYTSFADINIPNGGWVNIWSKHRDNERLATAVAVLVGDPLAASKAYGLRTEHCGICGRTLSVPSSIAAGIGPECAKKFG